MASDLQEITEGNIKDFFKSFAGAFWNMPCNLFAMDKSHLRNPNNMGYAGESVGYASAIALIFGAGFEISKYFN